jgi:hypothetical protein
MLSPKRSYELSTAQMSARHGFHASQHLFGIVDHIEWGRCVDANLAWLAPQILIIELHVRGGLYDRRRAAAAARSISGRAFVWNGQKNYSAIVGSA